MRRPAIANECPDKRAREVPILCTRRRLILLFGGERERERSGINFVLLRRTMRYVRLINVLSRLVFSSFLGEVYMGEGERFMGCVGEFITTMGFDVTRC